MVYIIIKTNQKLISELYSVHNTKEEASYRLTLLGHKGLNNKIANNNTLKVYENNYFLHNKCLFLYQIIKVVKPSSITTTEIEKEE